MTAAGQPGSNPPTGRHLVFISHSSRDTWVAKQIAREISAHGAAIFLDSIDIEAGTDFAEEIRTNLRRADELVVLWTPWALDRAFILAEIGGAWTRGIPIVQLLYGLTTSELVSRPEFPVFLKALDMIRLDDLDSYLRQLERRVRSEGQPTGGTNDGDS